MHLLTFLGQPTSLWKGDDIYCLPYWLLQHSLNTISKALSKSCEELLLIQFLFCVLVVFSHFLNRAWLFSSACSQCSFQVMTEALRFKKLMLLSKKQFLLNCSSRLCGFPVHSHVGSSGPTLVSLWFGGKIGACASALALFQGLWGNGMKLTGFIVWHIHHRNSYSWKRARSCLKLI